MCVCVQSFSFYLERESVDDGYKKRLASIYHESVINVGDAIKLRDIKKIE